MPRVTLSGGAYTARSIIASAQRQVNLYSETNPEMSPVKHTLYPMPGLTTLASPPVGAGRGMFRASNNRLYAVIGQTVYTVSRTWVFTAIGVLTAALTTPVRMSDNGTDMILVDGTAAGYTVNLITDAFGTISSAAFYGANRVGFLDTFFVLNKPDTGEFYASLANSLTFDPLYFATKIGYSDPLVSIAVLHREIWLIGRDTTEIWVNSGAANFPFEIMTGAFIQHGCAAEASVTILGDSVLWLSQNKEGQAVVLMGAGYQAKAVSTHAIVTAFSGYSTISDAVGMAFQMLGHQFYVLTFPTADKTWVYDISTGEWFEWVYSDGDGVEHRHRAGSIAFAYGVNIALDWQTGALYKLDLNSYTDFGVPNVYRRGFPHMTKDGKRVQYLQFIADMESGNAPGSATADIGPQVYLRYSDDKGATWSDPIANGIGAAGDYINSIQFQRLGMARDRVFEVFWSSSVRTALNGAYIETRVLGS